MLSRARARLTFANVVSCLALFAALGGTGYAVTEIDANSVGTKQLKRNAVVTKKVKNGSLLSKDFKAGQIPAGATGPLGPAGAKGDTGAAGIQGLKGDKGDKGDPGTNGTNGAPAASFLAGRSTYCDLCADNYSAPMGTSTASSTASDVDMVSPAQTIVARDLFVLRSLANFSTPPTFTLAVNGVDSALQCTMSPEDTATTCSDTTHAVAIPAGSTIAIHQTHNTSGGTGAANPYRVAWRATTP